jgi:hypothetical protein
VRPWIPAATAHTPPTKLNTAGPSVAANGARALVKTASMSQLGRTSMPSASYRAQARSAFDLL